MKHRVRKLNDEDYEWWIDIDPTSGDLDLSVRAADGGERTVISINPSGHLSRCGACDGIGLPTDKAGRILLVEEDDD